MAGTILTRKGKKGTTYRAKLVLVQNPSGKPITKTFKRKGDARAWLDETAAAVRAGTYAPLTGASHARTVGDLLEIVAAEFWTGEKRWHGKFRAYAGWWSARLGAVRLVDLTAEDVIESLNALRRGEGLSGCQVKEGTRRHYLLALSRAVRLAIKRDWLQRNPLERVEWPSKGKGRDAEPPIPEERERLLAACEDVSRDLGDLTLLAMSTGGRQQELMALRWRQVDLEAGRIRLMETKGDKPRTVPVRGPALSMLERRSVGRPPNGAVFPFARFPDYAWRKAREAAGMPELHFHDLRHWAASFYAMCGASLRQLADLLGHTDLKQVMRYSHLVIGSLDDIAGSVAARFLDDHRTSARRETVA